MPSICVLKYFFLAGTADLWPLEGPSVYPGQHKDTRIWLCLASKKNVQDSNSSIYIFNKYFFSNLLKYGEYSPQYIVYSTWQHFWMKTIQISFKCLNCNVFIIISTTTDRHSKDIIQAHISSLNMKLTSNKLNKRHKKEKRKYYEI